MLPPEVRPPFSISEEDIVFLGRSDHIQASVEVKNAWRASALAPLERVLPAELGITQEGLKRFDRLMYAFGTSEVKMATLALGLTPTFESASRIYRRTESFLPPDTWFPNVNVVRLNHLKESFLPTGLVEELREGYFVYYRSTKEGGEIGQSVAAFMLKSAAQQSSSFQEMLGSIITSSGSRSYINRVEILFALLNGQSFEAGIARRVGIDSNVLGANLEGLRDAGLINYESVTTTETKGWVSYRLVGDLNEVKHSLTLNRLRRNVLEYFRLNPLGNALTIAQVLGRTDEGDLITVLTELAGQGILERVGYHGAVKQSHAEIIPRGEEFLTDVIGPVLKACSGDPAEVAKMTRTCNEVRSNPDLIADALDLYARVSPGANRKSLEQTREDILGLIAERGPIRYQEIIKSCGPRAGVALRQLIDEGFLIKHKDEKAVFYLQPEQGTPSIKKQYIVYQYQPPEALLPRKDRPKEEYQRDLETSKFWSNLVDDLESVTEDETERIFFGRFREDNPNWMARDNYKSGKYMSLIAALRKLGISDPYAYLKGYVPQEANVREIALRAQNLMEDKLIPTTSARRFEEEVKEFDNPEFWAGLEQDLVTFQIGASFRSFMLFFDENNILARELFSPEGKRFYGKNRFILHWFMFHHHKLIERQEIKNLPQAILENRRKTMVAFLFAKAPEEVRKLLLQKFPKDFGEMLLISVEAKLEPSAFAEDIFKDVSADDVVGLYMKEVKSMPRLEKDEESRLLTLVEQARQAKDRLQQAGISSREKLALERAVKIGATARNRIVEANQRLVVSIARGYLGRGLDFSDLIHEGHLGLMKGIDNFDQALGYELST